MGPWRPRWPAPFPTGRTWSCSTPRGWGPGRGVVAAVAARGAQRVVHVACDPAALGRDVALFAEHGYRLTGLRALDLFPMTHHVEAVAVLDL